MATLGVQTANSPTISVLAMVYHRLFTNPKLKLIKRLSVAQLVEQRDNGAEGGQTSRQKGTDVDVASVLAGILQKLGSLLPLRETVAGIEITFNFYRTNMTKY